MAKIDPKTRATAEELIAQGRPVIVEGREYYKDDLPALEGRLMGRIILLVLLIAALGGVLVTMAKTI